MYDFDLFNKVVMITGATGLLGTQYAECLAKNNAKLLLCDINLEKVRSLADRLSDKYNSEAIGLHCDVRQKESITACVDEGVKHFGGLTSVINNAAATGESFL